MAAVKNRKVQSIEAAFVIEEASTATHEAIHFGIDSLSELSGSV